MAHSAFEMTVTLTFFYLLQKKMYDHTTPVDLQRTLCDHLSLFRGGGGGIQRKRCEEFALLSQSMVMIAHGFFSIGQKLKKPEDDSLR